MAFHTFADSHNGFPAIITSGTAATTISTGTAAHSWALDVLPFLEQSPIVKAYDKSASFSATDNLTVIANEIQVFECPSNPATASRTVALYDSSTGLALASSGGAIDYFPHGAITGEDLANGVTRNPALLADRVQPLSGIQDGLSQTILIDEVAMRPVEYINGNPQSNPVANPAAAAWGGFAQTSLYMYNADGTPCSTPLTAV